MKTFEEVAEWCLGAIEACGDPSLPVCQLFFAWQPNLSGISTDELACGMVNGKLVLFCGPDFPPFPLRVKSGEPEIADEGMVAYGATRITAGVWSLTPSLNVVGVIHGFVVLHGVPDPAPWERRIVLP